MATPIVNARTVRNGWGTGAGESGTNVANALKQLNTRWFRHQFDGDVSSDIQATQNGLVSVGAFDPNLKLQLLLNDYIQNGSTNTFNNQAGWILNNILPIKGPNGKSVLAAIEGPNEMNTTLGAGARGPNDLINKTGGTYDPNTGSYSGDVINDDPTADANFVDWAQTLGNWRNANATALAGIEILSPTILYYNGQNFPTSLNVSNYIDYGCFHFYAGINGNNGCPSWPSDPGNFFYMYNFAQAGIAPGKSFVQSEGGVSTQTGGGYGQDGRSSCRYQVMQILDHHAHGGHRFMIYNLINASYSVPGAITNYNEDNFGLFYGDWTPKPVVTALANLQNLLSLGNSYSNVANLTDTASFTPVYTGVGFSVSGLNNAGSAGSSMIMPKSDGSTMIAVWNEPTIDSGSGTSTSVAANPITVNFGSSQTYKVYDVMGGGNVDAFTVSSNAVSSPITTGTGTSVNLTLYGNPLFIELAGAPAPTQVPGASTVSVGKTTATTQDLSWTAATQSPTDYLITVTEVT